MKFSGLRYILVLSLLTTCVSSAAGGLLSSPLETLTSAIPSIDLENHASAKLTVRDAVQLAIVRNFNLRSQALTMAQKENIKWASFSDLLPQLNITYDSEINRYRQASNAAILSGVHPSRWSYRGQTNNPTLQPLYPYRIDPYKMMTLTATITQPIYDAGRLGNTYKYAVMEAVASGVDMETMRRDLTKSVIQSFYQILLGRRLLEVTEESIRELTAFRARAKALLKHGEALRVDVASAEANLARAKAKKTKVVTDLEMAQAQLNFLMAFPQSTCLKLDEQIGYEASPYKCPEIYMIAVSNRSEIRKANISIDQAKAQVKIAQASLVPTINLQLQGQRFNDDWNVLDPEGTNEWTIQGTLTWAFDLFRTRETVRQQRNAHAQSFVNREYLVQQIMHEVQSAYLQLKQSEADVEQFKSEIKWRQEQYNRIREMYNQQLTSYLHVMDAITNLDTSRSNYYTALANHNIYVAELERQMGILR